MLLYAPLTDWNDPLPPKPERRPMTLSRPMVVAAFLVVALGQVVAVNVGEYWIRREAIEANAAYYTVDPQTGETTFNWRTCE